MKRPKRTRRARRTAATGLGAYAEKLNLDADEVGCFRAIEDHVRMYGAASDGSFFILADTDPKAYHVNVVMPGGHIDMAVGAVLDLLDAADFLTPANAPTIETALRAPMPNGWCRAIVLAPGRFFVQDLRYVPTNAPGGSA